MNIIIGRIGRAEAVKFAADELEKYLKRMDPKSFIEARAYSERDPKREHIIWVGLDGSVEAAVDDTVKIDVKDGAGVITGSNERSVLLAVYRFLFELGCRWIRPGADGEVIPKKKLTCEGMNVNVLETAYMRHRGICIEGQVNYEHVRDLIEWMPKVGMNSYFVQFQTPSYFFKLWYNRESTDDVPVYPVDDDDVDHIWSRLEEEIDKRSLAYHAVGHSWTCEAFGVPGTEWRKHEEPLPEEFERALALRDGKRELWKYSVVNTNLCFSPKWVRDRIVDEVIEYCKKHPTANYINFWLADGENNHCECEECSKYRPSDYYIILLNEIDEAMTREGIDAKVVFLIYEDLLWEPEHFKLNNPDRFVLMFAPIRRSYHKAFADFDKEELNDTTPYVRNKNTFPNTVGGNVAYLYRWQEQFKGDSFDFDYHLMWNNYTDPGYHYIAELLHYDMKNLDKIGLNGMISCQINRTAFPTALPNYAMAKALWDKNSDFKDVCREYYAAAFGELWEVVCSYLGKLSVLFDLATVTENGDHAKFIENCKEAKALVEDFYEKYILPNESVNASWKYLVYHREFCLAYADLAIAAASGDKAEYEKLTAEFIEMLERTRVDIHNVYDSRFANRVYETYLPLLFPKE